MARVMKAEELRAAVDLRHAKTGLGVGAIAGATYGLVGVVGGIALAWEPLASATGIVTAALVLAALQTGLPQLVGIPGLPRMRFPCSERFQSRQCAAKCRHTTS